MFLLSKLQGGGGELMNPRIRNESENRRNQRWFLLDSFQTKFLLKVLPDSFQMQIFGWSQIRFSTLPLTPHTHTLPALHVRLASFHVGRSRFTYRTRFRREISPLSSFENLCELQAPTCLFCGWFVRRSWIAPAFEGVRAGLDQTHLHRVTNDNIWYTSDRRFSLNCWVLLLFDVHVCCCGIKLKKRFKSEVRNFVCAYWISARILFFNENCSPPVLVWLCNKNALKMGIGRNGFTLVEHV